MAETALSDRIGETVTTVQDFTVEAGKVTEYANAVLNDNPVHKSETAATRRGFTAMPAPLTFTATKRFPRYRPADVPNHWGFELGFDRLRTVHGEKAYEFDRPVQVGDKLTGETTLEDVYRRQGERGGEMTFAVLATEFLNTDTERVITERSTLIETEPR